MSQEQNSAEFDLVFEGPADDSTRTIQRLKGVFIADLEFSVEDVQRFLSSSSVIVKSGASEAELSREERLIRAAGGKVLIVRRAEQTAESSSESIADALLDLGLDGTPLDISPAATPAAAESHTAPAQSLSFALDSTPQAPSIKASKKREPSQAPSGKPNNQDSGALSFQLEEAPTVAPTISTVRPVLPNGSEISNIASAAELTSMAQSLEGLGLDAEEPQANLNVPTAKNKGINLDLTLAPALETDPEKLHQPSVAPAKEEWELPQATKQASEKVSARNNTPVAAKMLTPLSAGPMPTASNKEENVLAFEMLGAAPPATPAALEQPVMVKAEKPSAKPDEQQQTKAEQREESLAKLLAKRAGQAPLAPSPTPETVEISAPLNAPDEPSNLWRELGVPIGIGALVLLALHLGNYFVEPENTASKPKTVQGN